MPHLKIKTNNMENIQTTVESLKTLLTTLNIDSEIGDGFILIKGSKSDSIVSFSDIENFPNKVLQNAIKYSKS